MIPRVGIAAVVTTIVAGQLPVASVLDHFGLLGTTARTFDASRVTDRLTVK
jgi:transporter family-2 protein